MLNGAVANDSSVWGFIMKKIVSVLLVVFYTLSFSVTALAADIKLYAKNVNVSAGETFEISYRISNNSGIMGFAFELSFDNSVLEVVSVRKGEDLIGGIFNESISDKTKDSVKIVWTGTENFNKNCELFIVKFKAKELSSGETIVKIKSLSDDTFNEKWEEVNISGIDVSVKIANPAKQTIWDRIATTFLKIIRFIKSIFV